MTIIANAVTAEYPDADISGSYVKAPAKFPHISVEEIDNSTYAPTLTQNPIGDYATITYEINIYSNKTEGKKAECKAIANIADNALCGLGFIRIMLNPTPNIDDATIYRMTGRYRAIVSNEKQIYRR